MIGFIGTVVISRSFFKVSRPTSERLFDSTKILVKAQRQVSRYDHKKDWCQNVKKTL